MCIMVRVAALSCNRVISHVCVEPSEIRHESKTSTTATEINDAVWSFVCSDSCFLFTSFQKPTNERTKEREREAEWCSNILNHKNNRNEKKKSKAKPSQAKAKLLWVYWTDTKIEFSFHIRRKQIIDFFRKREKTRKNDNHYDRDFQKNHLTNLQKNESIFVYSAIMNWEKDR